MSRLENTVAEMEGEIKERIKQLTTNVQDLTCQINEHKQDAQAKEEAVRRYVDEQCNTIVCGVKAQLQQLRQALMDCMQRLDNQLRKKLVPCLTATSTPAIPTRTSTPAPTLIRWSIRLQSFDFDVQ